MSTASQLLESPVHIAQYEEHLQQQIACRVVFVIFLLGLSQWSEASELPEERVRCYVTVAEWHLTTHLFK